MGYQLDWSILWTYHGLLLSGLSLTCQLFAMSAAGAVLVGILMGIVRTSKMLICRLISTVYIEINRNTPLVVKLCFLYFVFSLPPFITAILGLVIHQSSYIAEDVRAAVQSIPRGQSEAALSTGLGRWHTIRHVILPQAFNIALPALVIELIEILKNSSIAMVITVEELTFTSQQIDSITFRGFEVATAVTLLYLVLAWLISRIATVYRATVPAAKSFAGVERMNYPTT